MKYILSIIAIILYYFAPLKYSTEFCYLCLIVFIICTYNILKHDIYKIGVINFNSIFLLSFFLFTYTFPIFLLPMGEVGYLYKVPGLDDTTINKTTALNTFAITIYSIAYFSYKKTTLKNKINISKRFISYVKYSLCVLSILVILSTLIFSNTNTDSVAVTNNPFLMVMYKATLAIFMVITLSKAKENNIKLQEIISNNKFLLLLIITLVITYLYIGDRGPVFTILLIILGSYIICYKKLSIIRIISIAIISFILLLFIGLTRGGDSSIKTIGIMGAIDFVTEIVSSQAFNSGFWFLLDDFSGRYIEINCGYKYVQDYGYLYPLKIFPIIFSPLPLFPTALSYIIYGKSFMELSSGVAINQTLFADRDGWMGSHCVIDAYMSWGVLGVTIIFFIIGYVHSILSKHYKDNLLYTSLYITLISCSLYMPRAVIYENYRVLSWTFIFFLIYVRVSKFHSYKK